MSARKNYRYVAAVVIVLIVIAAGYFYYQSTVPTASTTTTVAAKQFKMALLLPGPANDVSFNQGGYVAVKSVASALNSSSLNVQYVVNENVAVSDVERLERQYAQQGYNFIVAHGVEFQDQTIRVAKDFPNVFFTVSAGFGNSTDNVAYTEPGFYKDGYLVGLVAAHLTKTGKIGFVYALDIPSYKAWFQNTKLGVEAVNKSLTFTGVATGDFNDVTKAKEATQALISQGYDVIVNGGDGLGVGVISAAKDAGVWTTGAEWDQSALYPGKLYMSTVWNFTVAFEAMVHDVLTNGKFSMKVYPIDLNNGGCVPLLHIQLPADVQAQYDQALADLKSGKIHIVTAAEVSGS
ncbi:MAG: BMP family protein [Candidatus Bathyarchaeia archaeon]|jgi:basic membrane lipoprotein Med (substrate-binding protein (PBP1-ABC) superfamily)